MNKRILTALLAFILAFTGIFMPQTAYAERNHSQEASDTENLQTTELEEDLSVKGTNSFGNLLAGELSQKADEQQENQGCNIFSIEVADGSANISFETDKDCTLVVSVYEEDGVKMISSSDTEVYAGDTQASVTLSRNVPQYFYLRGFLVETDTLRPLCVAYESPMYTQEMQEFLAKTTDDFEADKVLNLDADPANNFAVYNDGIIRIPQSTERNKVISADEEANVYVIEHADENISSLQKDDVFSYEYGDNKVLIVKVADIRMDGTTATITGADASMEDVFAYVKIDGEAGTEDLEVDASNLEEDVAYKGMVEHQERQKICLTATTFFILVRLPRMILGSLTLHMSQAKRKM